MTMTGSVNHSGDYLGRGDKKNKKTDTVTWFIDTTVAFSPSAAFPLKAFRVKAEETK